MAAFTSPFKKSATSCAVCFGRYCRSLKSRQSHLKLNWGWSSFLSDRKVIIRKTSDFCDLRNVAAGFFDAFDIRVFQFCQLQVLNLSRFLSWRSIGSLVAQRFDRLLHSERLNFSWSLCCSRVLQPIMRQHQRCASFERWIPCWVLLEPVPPMTRIRPATCFTTASITAICSSSSNVDASPVVPCNDCIRSLLHMPLR